MNLLLTNDSHKTFHKIQNIIFLAKYKYLWQMCLIFLVKTMKAPVPQSHLFYFMGGITRQTVLMKYPRVHTDEVHVHGWAEKFIGWLLMIWQSPGLPGWWKVNFITVTRRPHHPNIAAGLCCLATSPGFLPTLCEKWSELFYVHRVFLSYTLRSCATYTLRSCATAMTLGTH